MTIEVHDVDGKQISREVHHPTITALRERDMVEEVTTAMERRRQAHGEA